MTIKCKFFEVDVRIKRLLFENSTVPSATKAGNFTADFFAESARILAAEIAALALVAPVSPEANDEMSPSSTTVSVGRNC